MRQMASSSVIVQIALIVRIFIKDLGSGSEENKNWNVQTPEIKRSRRNGETRSIQKDSLGNEENGTGWFKESNKMHNKIKSRLFNS